MEIVKKEELDALKSKELQCIVDGTVYTEMDLDNNPIAVIIVGEILL